MRVYAPQIGKWIQRDPSGEGSDVDLSRYCNGDPINGRDPTGMRETDDRVWKKTENLVDVSAKLEAYVNEVISAKSAEARAAGLSAKRFAELVYEALGADAPGSEIYGKAPIGKMGVWLDSNLDASGNEIAFIKFNESRYRWNDTSWANAPSRPWLISQATAQHGLAPVINIGGTLMGTDKWEHFFQQGFWLAVWSDGAGKCKLETDADRMRFCLYMEGDYDSKTAPAGEEAAFQLMARAFTGEPLLGKFKVGSFGSATTGVTSYADIQANLAGYKFYEKLMDAYRKGGNYNFKVSDYDTRTFNESTVTPNKFASDLKVNDAPGIRTKVSGLHAVGVTVSGPKFSPYPDIDVTP